MGFGLRCRLVAFQAVSFLGCDLRGLSLAFIFGALFSEAFIGFQPLSSGFPLGFQWFSIRFPVVFQSLALKGIAWFLLWRFCVVR